MTATENQTTTATTVGYETWVNTQAAEVWITKLLESGPTATRVRGGKPFTVTAAERRYHQSDCTNEAADPYQNGHLRQTDGEPYIPPFREVEVPKAAPVPLTMADIDMSDPATALAQFEQLQRQQLGQFAEAMGLAATAAPVELTEDEIAQIPAMGDNPNQLSDDEVTWLLTCADPRLVGWRLDRITAEVALQGLLAGAREVSPVSRQEDLARRIVAINPRAVTLPGSVSAGDGNGIGRPAMLDMDRLHERPATGDVAELAPGARTTDGAMMVEAPPVGAPAPEPLPPHLAAFKNAAQ